MQKTLIRTAAKVKFEGMTFLHQSKCTETNHEPKQSLLMNGTRYYKVKNGAVIDSIPDHVTVDEAIDIPTAEEIKSLESEGSLVVTEGGEIKAAAAEQPTAEQPKIKYDEAHPGKKTAAKYFYPKTGNYVSYARAVQLKLV